MKGTNEWFCSYTLHVIFEVCVFDDGGIPEGIWSIAMNRASKEARSHTVLTGKKAVTEVLMHDT